MSLLSEARSSLQFRRRNIKDSQADPTLFASSRSLGTQKLRSRLRDLRENSTGNIRKQEFLFISIRVYNNVA